MRLLRPTVLTAIFGLSSSLVVLTGAAPAMAEDDPCFHAPTIVGAQASQIGTELTGEGAEVENPVIDVTVTVASACYVNLRGSFHEVTSQLGTSGHSFDLESIYFQTISGNDSNHDGGTVVQHIQLRVPTDVVGGNYALSLAAGNLYETLGTSWDSGTPLISLVDQSTTTLTSSIENGGVPIAGVSEIALNGSFLGSQSKPATGTPLTLEEHTAGTAWHPRARPTTDDAGIVGYIVTPVHTTQYRLSGSAAGFTPSDATIVVPVAAKVAVKASASTVKKGGSVAIRGAVFPTGRVRVQLQRRLSGGTWRLSGQRWTDSHGRFAFATKVIGAASYRVTTAETLLNRTGTSNAVAVRLPAVRRVVTPAPAPSQPSDVYYPNCTAARAAGAAPIYAGEPGYRAGLDRDSDGVACE